MIKTFRQEGIRRLFETGSSHAIADGLSRPLTRQLDFLNRAVSPVDMDLPGYRLNELNEERKGMWSITVSGNRRLTFSFHDRDAFEVALEDYR